MRGCVAGDCALLCSRFAVAAVSRVCLTLQMPFQVATIEDKAVRIAPHNLALTRLEAITQQIEATYVDKARLTRPWQRLWHARLCARAFQRAGSRREVRVLRRTAVAGCAAARAGGHAV